MTPVPVECPELIPAIIAGTWELLEEEFFLPSNKTKEITHKRRYKVQTRDRGIVAFEWVTVIPREAIKAPDQRK